MDGEIKIEDGASLLGAAKFVKDKVAGRAWYRGQAKADWDLVPKAYEREGREGYDEEHLTNYFRLRGKSRYADCPEHDDVTGWLTLMRHYGLPTRLLDWTESILIAAFFCVSDAKYKDADGAIWAIDPDFVNKRFTGVPSLLQINSRVPKILAYRAFNPLYKVEDCHVVEDVRLAEDCHTVEGAVLAKDCGAIEDVVLAVLAAEIDNRMIMQQATFTIHGSSAPSLTKCSFDVPAVYKVGVPKEAKAGIAEDLECLGIRRSNLFPDLEALASELENEPLYENQLSS